MYSVTFPLGFRSFLFMNISGRIIHEQLHGADVSNRFTVMSAMQHYLPLSNDHTPVSTLALCT